MSKLQNIALVCAALAYACGGSQLVSKSTVESGEAPNAIANQEPAPIPAGRELPVSSHESRAAYCQAHARSDSCRGSGKTKAKPRTLACAGEQAIELDRIPSPYGAGLCRLLWTTGDRVWSIDPGLACTVSSFDAAFPDWQRTSLAGVECVDSAVELQLTVAVQQVNGKESPPAPSPRRLRCTVDADQLRCEGPAALAVDHDRRVQEFASEVARTATAHDWDRLFEMCSAEHRDTQLGLGMTRPNYLAEILGLNVVGNTLTDGAITEEALNQIAQLEVVDIFWNRFGNYQALAVVTLTDGRQLRGFLDIVTRDGRLALAGTVG